MCMHAQYWSDVNCVSFGITSTMDNEIHSGMLRTRVSNCQLVSVKKNDFSAIMHRVRILHALSTCQNSVKEKCLCYKTQVKLDL